MRKTNRKPRNVRHLGKCVIDGCTIDAVGRGLCDLHWQRAKTAGMLDKFPKFQRTTCDECPEKHYAHGKCQKHYYLLKKART